MNDIEWVDKVLDPSGKILLKRILQELKKRSEDGEIIYPEPDNIFRALKNLDSISVIILGQDPYHGEGQANGFAFAVNKDVPVPPSLRNIMTELKSDIGVGVNRTLEEWAEQGVMLLNTTLTVSKGIANSHEKLGWNMITNCIIRYLSETKENLVFILWGKNAQQKIGIIDQSKHLVIASPHPSPFSAHGGFFNSKSFSRTNTYLLSVGKQPIVW